MEYQLYIGVAVAISLIVLGVAYGISKVATKAVESIARQPESASDINRVMFTPCALIEGAGIVSILLCGLIIFLK